MKKQIVYVFINPKTGLVSSLAFACSTRQSAKSDQQLLEEFEPGYLTASHRLQFDYIISKGNSFCNWHVAKNPAEDFCWPATRAKFHYAA